jgi:2-polyprenyl-3-methyl-5-hydroxy-6-metoxy-1,4-benzoquinol methylase
MRDHVAEYEKQKYQKIWTFDEYRQTAPGEKLVKSACSELGIQTGEHVIDFGCGTGRSMQIFHEMGVSVLGVDIAPNCLDEENQKFKLIESCLWNLPTSLMEASFEWGYCTDVMEHIPPQYVEETVKKIRQTITKGAYFQIALFNDSMGSLIGEKLHLSVCPANYWENLLKRHFVKVRHLNTQNHNAIFVCHEPFKTTN